MLNQRHGLLVGLHFSEARERIPGINLEGVAAIEVIGGALKKLTQRGIVGPGDFPLPRYYTPSSLRTNL